MFIVAHTFTDGVAHHEAFAQKLSYELHSDEEGHYEIIHISSGHGFEDDATHRETVETFDAADETRGRERHQAICSSMEDSYRQMISQPDPEDIAYERDIQAWEDAGIARYEALERD